MIYALSNDQQKKIRIGYHWPEAHGQKTGIARYIGNIRKNVHNLNFEFINYADPKRADLKHADLKHADPRHADLRRADPKRADPRRVDPRHANPRRVDPRHADLRNFSIPYLGRFLFLFRFCFRFLFFFRFLFLLDLLFFSFNIRRQKLDVYWGSAHKLPLFRIKGVSYVVTIYDLVWKTCPLTMPLRRRLTDG